MEVKVKAILSGNEAIARGAWEAGVAVASAYPGTPSTEILENLATYSGVYAEWAPNEKVAVDVAAGAAYNGRRAMATMKHVGLNVAADSFFYIALTGAEAGLVIISADDPGMHSSQNEQDSRNYAKFARVPCLDPSDSQEAKDMVMAAFDLSEQFDTPVLVRMTTRVAHSSSVVELGERVEHGRRVEQFPRNMQKYVALPAIARRLHVIQEERMNKLADFAETFAFNRMEMGSPDLGIVSSGVAYQYAREVFPTASFLKLGMSYPMPRRMIADFARQVKRLIVIEEGDPFLEEGIRLLGIAAEGKAIFPLCGELSVQVVRDSAVAAGLLPESDKVRRVAVETGPLPPRPPVLCPGCPHRPVFAVLRKLKMPVMGDIGCYTLGALPPLSTIHTTGCMGAGIGVAHGADKAGDGQERFVAVIGDSTFFHTGLPALLNVAYNRSRVITVIMDNRVTAMTGHQHNPGTGQTLQGQPTHEVELEPLVRAMGVQNVYTVDSYQVNEVERVFRECLAFDGPSVIITRRECALLPMVRKQYVALRVNPEKCVACGTCLRTGCPALTLSDEVYEKTGKYKTRIDPLLCTGCEVCAQVCPKGAILFRHEVQQPT